MEASHDTRQVDLIFDTLYSAVKVQQTGKSYNLVRGGLHMEFTAPLKPSKSEMVIKRSRFIGHAFPAFSEDEAKEHIESIRQEHRAATHNVFAYSISVGAFAEKAFDDGEPKGTAGYPVLDVIRKRNLQNVVCVVTRYFGGVKLGARGLVRAYSNTASKALDSSGLAVYKYHGLFSAVVAYDQFERIKREIEMVDGVIHNTSFAEKIAVQFYVIPDVFEQLTSLIKDVTSGQGLVKVSQGKYLPTKEFHPKNPPEKE